MDTRWVAILLVAVAAFSLLRIISQWRRYSRRQVADWDEQFIMQLRKAGVNPFEDHTVDFFFTLPDARSCEEVRRLLADEGFVRISQAETAPGNFSLNLQRRMRLVVPEMQALTARFTQLAEERGGKYDNWAVGRERGE